VNLKSAWEISLEKANALDGRGAEEIALTEGQKAKIQEIRKEYEGKIAEREIMLQKRLQDCGAEEAEGLKEEFRGQRQGFWDERDARIEQCRKNG